VARLALTLALVVVAGSAASGAGSAPSACTPTRSDSLGPYYEPDAPVRSKVGTGGYVLTGRVLATRTCRPLGRARIEFWLVNEQGEYDDAHRATVFSRRTGSYRFESNRPVGYSGRRPHIHVRVSARGFRTLVTQHHPRSSRRSATFNLVLVRQ
jgi:protocatechuate 3,4-dioxygenase beta subunit